MPGVADDRIEGSARCFSAREFERVDFLRIDSGALYFSQDDLGQEYSEGSID